MSSLDYRYLRIGVLWHDTLTEELVIKRGKVATVGEKKADLMVPSSAAWVIASKCLLRVMAAVL